MGGEGVDGRVGVDERDGRYEFIRKLALVCVINKRRSVLRKILLILFSHDLVALSPCVRRVMRDSEVH